MSQIKLDSNKMLKIKTKSKKDNEKGNTSSKSLKNALKSCSNYYFWKFWKPLTEILF